MIVQDQPRAGRLTLTSQKCAGVEQVPLPAADGSSSAEATSTKTVHVQVKNSNFTLGLKLSGTDFEAKPLDFSKVTLNVSLIYDTEELREVHFVKNKPIDFRTKVSKDSTEADLRCRISILTSQHEGLNFRARVEAVVPTGTPDDLEGCGLVVFSEPIRVVSKPEQLPGRQKNKGKKRSLSDSSNSNNETSCHPMVNYLLDHLSIPSPLSSPNPTSPTCCVPFSPLPYSQMPLAHQEPSSPTSSGYPSPRGALGCSNPDLASLLYQHSSGEVDSNGAHLQLNSHLRPPTPPMSSASAPSSSPLPCFYLEQQQQPQQAAASTSTKRRRTGEGSDAGLYITVPQVRKEESFDALLSRLLDTYSAMPLEQRAEAVRRFGRNCDSNKTEQASELFDAMASSLGIPTGFPVFPTTSFEVGPVLTDVGCQCPSCPYKAQLWELETTAESLFA